MRTGCKLHSQDLQHLVSTSLSPSQGQPSPSGPEAQGRDPAHVTREARVRLRSPRASGRLEAQRLFLQNPHSFLALPSSVKYLDPYKSEVMGAEATIVLSAHLSLKLAPMSRAFSSEREDRGLTAPQQETLPT